MLLPLASSDLSHTGDLVVSPHYIYLFLTKKNQANYFYSHLILFSNALLRFLFWCHMVGFLF